MLKKVLICTSIVALSLTACHSSKDAAKTTAAKSSLTNTYWKLVELNGKAVNIAAEATGDRVPHLTLSEKDLRISGSGGCNSFTGEYETPAPGRIRFNKIVATQKMCMGESIESDFFKVLNVADAYVLADDGKSLILNRARMAPLARFIAVKQ